MAVTKTGGYLYSRALLLNYGALFFFVVTSLFWLGQAALAIPTVIPIATFSAGVTHLQPGDTQVSVTKRADEAMYAAKQAGKNRVMIG